MVSAASEWSVAVLIMFSLLTFVFDLKKIKLSEPRVKENAALTPAGRISKSYFKKSHAFELMFFLNYFKGEFNLNFEP